MDKLLKKLNEAEVRPEVVDKKLIAITKRIISDAKKELNKRIISHTHIAGRDLESSNQMIDAVKPYLKPGVFVAIAEDDYDVNFVIFTKKKISDAEADSISRLINAARYDINKGDYAYFLDEYYDFLKEMGIISKADMKAIDELLPGEPEQKSDTLYFDKDEMESDELDAERKHNQGK